ncbi:NYN domain-containing protein [Ornithinimicrobium sufpigmenti]|uniref:NYN domain-containing protein n=1 Tax=Ornithinimicrobium sufpigmenti TaxID=2508882 RepID=UPI001035748B|nr:MULTISPECIES: NYN domain-containing protein [unclassified Ornithinimicrobium]
MDDEDRIALLIDYENLALGARDHLGAPFDLRPVADALAERGRVVTRRAYADWSYFDEDRRMLTRNHVELIEMTQRMGASRKNAADIKMAVDAIEMAYERDYITTFAICTGDSDFTPLVHKLRELNKRVIGFGVRDSTSTMLPPACDEFLFYDDLDGAPHGEVRGGEPSRGRRRGAGGGKGQKSRREGNGPAGPEVPREPVDRPVEEPLDEGTDEPVSHVLDQVDEVDEVDELEDTTELESPDLDVLVAQTVAGLQRGSGGAVTASVLKRTLLRKDSTFSEAAHGFRAFGELLEHLADRGIIALSAGPAKGDPEVTLPEGGRPEAFALLSEVVQEMDEGEGVPLSGLKDQLRARRPGFSEKPLGYGSFLQFCRGAAAAGVVDLERDGNAYLVHPFD